MTEEIKTKETIEEVKPISQTYEDVAITWLGDLWEKLRDIPEASHLFSESKPSETVKESVIRFAHFLDGFTTMSMQMELLALRASRKIDREFMEKLIEEIGTEKSTEIAKEINLRHSGIVKDNE